MSEPTRRPPTELHRDVEAALAARRDLGPDYDDQIAAGLAERIDDLVALRLAETRTAAEERREEREDASSSRTQRFVLGIVSVGTGIPIAAIAGSDTHGGLMGLAIAWIGIVGVNVAVGWGARRR